MRQLFILIIFLLSFSIYGCGGGGDEIQETPVTQEEENKVETKEEQTSSPSPTINKDLGYDYLKFNSEFNENAAKIDERFIWSVGKAELKDGVQKVFTYKFTPKIIMQGAMNPSNETMKEVWILSNTSRKDESTMLIRLYIILFRTMNQGISDSDITALMSELKFDDLEALKNSGGTAVRGNVRYKTILIPGTGLMLTASAKDL